MLTHGIATGDLFISTFIPIPKARNANLTSADNYRGIALSAILGKLFDLIVLVRYVIFCVRQIFNLVLRVNGPLVCVR